MSFGVEGGNEGETNLRKLCLKKNFSKKRFLLKTVFFEPEPPRFYFKGGVRHAIQPLKNSLRLITL